MTNRHLISLCALALCATAHAETSISDANNEFSFMLGARYQLYEEMDSYNQVPSKYLDSETGYEPTVQIGASRQGTLFGLSNIYTAADVSLSAGRSDYSGYELAPAPPHNPGQPLTESKTGVTADVHLKLGRSFPLVGGRIQETPYLVYGYHRWARDSIETYSNHELGVGLLSQYSPTEKLVLGLDISVSRTFAAEVQTHHGVDEDLGSRYSPSATLRADYAITKCSHLIASWQIDRFAYGQSGNVTGVYAGMQGTWYEPSSRTFQQTWLVGYAYSF